MRTPASVYVYVAVPSSHTSGAFPRAWLGFNMTQRTHARGTSRGLTFRPAIQPGPTGSPGARAIFYLCSLREFASLLLSSFHFLIFRRSSSPSLLPKLASFFLLSFFLHLRHGNAEVVSAPVQVFINTHTYARQIEIGKLYRVLTCFLDVLGTPFCPSLPPLYRVTSFKRHARTNFSPRF